ncbi:MAG TPA: hypothetical protein VNG31_02080 [Candidatus Baltobacteraceae bacterium]|nr:hypothetical protein [Candidatus Baltobacteraceae bacterium]
MFGDASQVIAFSTTQAGLVYFVINNQNVYASQSFGQSATPLSGWPAFNRVVTSPATTANWLYGLHPYYTCTASSAVTYGECQDLRYSSTGGQKWDTARYTGGVCPYVAAVAVNPISPNIVVLACFTKSGVEIFQSTDYGTDFAPTTYVVASDRRARGNDYAALFRSIVPNADLLKTNAALAFYAYPTDLEYNPSPPTGQNPALILTTSRGGAVSTDDGASWTTINGNAIATLWTRVAWANGYAFIATRGQGVLMAPVQTASSTSR